MLQLLATKLIQLELPLLNITGVESEDITRQPFIALVALHFDELTAVSQMQMELFECAELILAIEACASFATVFLDVIQQSEHGVLLVAWSRGSRVWR